MLPYLSALFCPCTHNAQACWTLSIIRAQILVAERHALFFALRVCFKSFHWVCIRYLFSESGNPQYPAPVYGRAKCSVLSNPCGCCLDQGPRLPCAALFISDAAWPTAFHLVSSILVMMLPTPVYGQTRHPVFSDPCDWCFIEISRNTLFDVVRHYLLEPHASISLPEALC